MSTSSQTRVAAASLRSLLDGLVDYAGLFPPAALSMQKAVENYARYLGQEDRWALARFIVPVAKLAEFEKVQQSLLTPALLEQLAVTSVLVGDSLSRGQSIISDLMIEVTPLQRETIASTFPWRISAIAGENASADCDVIKRFNDEHGRRALVDTVEVKAASIDDVRRIRPLITEGVMPYFEIPADSRPEFFQMIAAVNARAKIRTGGIVETAFPAAQQVADFIVKCAEAKVAFKATAGLHHPVRCIKPLTYEPNAAIGKMHGFLNVFLGACFYYFAVQDERADRAQLYRALLAILSDEQPANFVFSDDKAQVNAMYSETHAGVLRNTNFSIDISTEHIRQAREKFAISFGSCSFEEPIEDLRSLHLL